MEREFANSCCGEKPREFVREGAEHTGVDVVIRCRRCEREIYSECRRHEDVDRNQLRRVWNGKEKAREA